MRNNLLSYREKGFTLIELLISMALFAMGLLSIFSLQQYAYTSIADAKLKKQAAFFISSYYEIEKINLNAQNIDSTLEEKWLNRVKKILPDIDITYQDDPKKIQALGLGDEVFSVNQIISLHWPSYHKVAHCYSDENHNKDCIKL